MTGDTVLLVVQSEVEDLFVSPPHENVPPVHIPVLKLQCLHVPIAALLRRCNILIEVKGVLMVGTTPSSQLAQI